MQTTVYLVTPPFTQLNTPYPATAYLKGFLNKIGVPSFQSDLGLEVILALFTKTGLETMFTEAAQNAQECSTNAKRIISLKNDYINTIDDVIAFLQGKRATLAYRICEGQFLPRASRFDTLNDIEWAFGQMGITDKAKHLSTLYLEDLGDFIQETIDEHFGFSRYAESLGRSANSFDALHAQLQAEPGFIDRITLSVLDAQMKQHQPKLVAFSVPFPGNLYSALRCSKWIRSHYPEVRIAMGGGFPNTELRSLKDSRVFDYVHYITLDDGEAPIQHLLEYIDGRRDSSLLKRTFLCNDKQVAYIDQSIQRDYTPAECGTPDYGDLLLDRYLSVIEILNPMHRLWNDGRWNKLTMAHGCYWGKCTFCDLSLNYIRHYEANTATLICDRMQEMINATGETGFHFVDEAAPPALMRALALEIIQRNMNVSWWTNIRFEKSFSRDLCFLLKASGCIGVSGGLEVASDRLLVLIQKGVTVEQVAVVMNNFTQAGILVHAYLMYGFPTQTEQETIDSLEMVRQLFACGVLKSGYWHRFAMTVHSPVGMEPEKFKVKRVSTVDGTFANNDLEYTDDTGARHELLSHGLRKSILNFMHGIGLDQPVQSWFDHNVPKPAVDTGFIQSAIDRSALQNHSAHAKLYWVGKMPSVDFQTKSKKGRIRELATLHFPTLSGPLSLQIDKEPAEWLMGYLQFLDSKPAGSLRFAELQADFERSTSGDFDLFWYNKPMNAIHLAGFLVI